MLHTLVYGSSLRLELATYNLHIKVLKPSLALPVVCSGQSSGMQHGLDTVRRQKVDSYAPPRAAPRTAS